MSDRWTERLSEFVDGDLPAADRAALETHLAGCEECAGIAAELRDVVAVAGSLEDREPNVDLWPGIAARLTEAPGVTRLSTWRRRHVALSVPQLAAAGLAFFLVSSGLVWTAIHRGNGGTEGPDLPAVMVGAAQPAPTAAYDAAIADLETVLDSRRALLDTATVRVLEESLATIDRAIVEARAALDEDPASGYLNRHLMTTMQRKLDLLQQAASLAPAAS
jgi:anti-sigma factor RsiW